MPTARYVRQWGIIVSRGGSCWFVVEPWWKERLNRAAISGNGMRWMAVQRALELATGDEDRYHVESLESS